MIPILTDKHGGKMKRWSVVVIIEGRTLKATSDGTEEGTKFTGMEEDVEKAKAILQQGFEIFLGSSYNSPAVKASYDSALGLTAALMGAAPYDAVLWRAPKDVLQFIEDFHNN